MSYLTFFHCTPSSEIYIWAMWFEHRGDGWDWGWCGRCDGWRNEESNFTRWDKINKLNMLVNTTSHLHIVAALCLRCIKDAPEVNCGESGRWTVKSVAPRPSWCRHQHKWWWVIFIQKRSIDICLPCCFCTLLSKARPRCVCKWFVKLQIVECSFSIPMGRPSW